MTTRLQLTIAIVLTLASVVLVRQASAEPLATRALAAVAAPTPARAAKRPTTPVVRAAIGRIMTAVRAQATPNLCGYEVPPQMFAHVR